MRRGAWLLTLLGLVGTLGLASGCAGPSAKDLKRLRVENELLREEIAVIRRNCDRYGGVKLEAEEEEGEPSGAPAP